VSGPNNPRSVFDRSFSHKTTFNSGLLIPVFVDEVLPGDTMSLRPAFLARLSTPLRPYMDGIHLDYQFWAVPLRLVWTNFVRMMGERPDPADHNDYTVPQMVAPPTIGHSPGTLSDYLTLPTQVPDYTHSSLFHRAYSLIYQEWYRDENLQDRVQVDLDDGPDDVADYPMRRRGKRKDYFSGALPFAQKGDPVQMPLGTTAPITGAITGTQAPIFVGSTLGGPAPLKVETTVPTGDVVWESGASGGSQPGDLLWDDPKLDISGLSVDLSAATAATINEMRTAITLQHLLERDARGGTRYRELILSHFGVSVPDLRLFRPELLATGSFLVNPTQVAQTAATATPLGDLGAYSLASQVGGGFMKSFDEHMIVMGIVSVRAELTYQQGLHRMFSRKTRFEFYWPDLAHLGEQTVLSREIYTDGTGDEAAMTGDFSIWGYQPRYEEYRHRHSVISGEFRSVFVSSLDIWHLALDFATRPVLNAAFIEENPPISRILVVPSAPEFLLDCYFKIRHVRPMPKFATPGLLRF